MLGVPVAGQDDVVDNRVAAVVIMAAGAGTRMKSAIPKVLHRLAGKSLVALAIDSADALAPERLVVVVGVRVRDAGRAARVCQDGAGAGEPPRKLRRVVPPGFPPSASLAVPGGIYRERS